MPPAKNMTVYQKDVKTAFFNGELKEVDMSTKMEGFVDPGTSHINVYSLMKAHFMVRNRPPSGMDTFNIGSYGIERHAWTLTAYADADHAGCQDTRRSTSGSAQFLGDKLVSWSSKKQTERPSVNREAEYMRCLGVVPQIPMGCWFSIIRLWLCIHLGIPMYCGQQECHRSLLPQVQHSRDICGGIISTKAAAQEDSNYFPRLGMKCMKPETLKSLQDDQDV
ncbi:retrovirus-related pol polyprotein from transposon TNT 1-94 [Tanacetum coccineum]